MVTAPYPVSDDPSLVAEFREKLNRLADSIESCADRNYWRIPLALDHHIKAARDLIARTKPTLYSSGARSDQMDAKREVPGFFFIGVNGSVITETPPLPKQYPSLDTAKGWLEQKLLGKTQPTWNVTLENEGVPIVWSATVDDHVITIMYIGSFRYFDGRTVDTTIVGTDQELQ